MNHYTFVLKQLFEGNPLEKQNVWGWIGSVLSLSAAFDTDTSWTQGDHRHVVEVLFRLKNRLGPNWTYGVIESELNFLLLKSTT